MSRSRASRARVAVCSKKPVRLAIAMMLGVCVVSPPANVQAQTPAPLPGAPSDSITRLAVDPATNTGRPYMLLLDEAINRMERDGRSVRTTRQVYQVLDQSVVRGLSERAFGYAKSHQELRIDWIRVLKPSGEVISDKPAQEQESDVPAAMNNPVYQEQRVKRVSLAGVAVGTILDIQVTLEEKAPYRANDFLLSWNVNSQMPVKRSRFVVDVPDGYTPKILERNLNFRRTEVVADGRRVYTWFASDIVPFLGEAFAADSNGVVMSVAVSAPTSWNEIAQWYNTLAKDRYTLSPAMSQRVDSLLGASRAASRADTIKAVHRWVAQDVRYVSVSLGIGGYQPRTPDEVLRSGFGDCKDKATLFVAALRRYNIAANPVLLSLTGKPDPALPSMYQFNHAIAAVQTDGGWTYTDLTAEFMPYGMIPDAYQGQFGIVVLPNGNAQDVRFPLTPITDNVSIMRLHAIVDTGGAVVVRVHEETRGSPSTGPRSAFGVPMDSTRRSNMQKALAQRLFPTESSADSLTGFDGKDFSQPAVLTYVVTGNNVLKTVGSSKLFSMNTGFKGPARSYKNLVRDLEARKTRVFPIDASRILGMVATETDLRITLPEGWTAELPKNVMASSFFGTYESTWTQDGREVRMVRRIRGERGVYPPQRISEVIVWLKTVSADDYEFLSLRPAGGR